MPSSTPETHYVTVAPKSILIDLHEGRWNMNTHSLFIRFFAAGIAFIGFAQVYLLKRLDRLLRRSHLRPRLRRVAFVAVCAFFGLLYMPQLLRFIYRWPEQQVFAVVLCGLL
jgi:H+/Cl- antiporter ClcA